MLFAVPTFAEDGAANQTDTCAHAWSEWYVVNQPSCGNTGIEERQCSICYEKETKQIPATGEHYWSEWETTKMATVFSAGSMRRVCWDCGYVQTSSISRVNAFARFMKKSYKVAKGKTLKLSAQIRKGNGDTVKKWKVSNKKIATISKSGKIKARKTGKVKVTAILTSGKKATCIVKVTKPKKSSGKSSSKSSSNVGKTVYWTPSGSVYHVRRSCPTLSRSKIIKSGSKAASGKSRCCKVCG